MHLVWFKRDLRLHDHAALCQAVAASATDGQPVACVYILEPELWQQPDTSFRQYMFLRDCLKSLHAALAAKGVPLILKVGEAVSALEDLHKAGPITALYSHQETWNGWTYERDKAVLAWTKVKDIPWHEPRQNGVVRRLQNRNGWAAKWYAFMSQPQQREPAPWPVAQALESDRFPKPEDLCLKPCGIQRKYLQTGGREEGLALLHSFLNDRGEHYTKAMSSPVTAFEACSRISAHIAFGCLGMREVFQVAEKRAQELRNLPPEIRGRWPSAVKSFSSRLRWHCHFMQKLEDEPRMEWENLHRGFNHLRTSFGEAEAAKLEAWRTGQTGYPLVDACMRALTATGYLNFRMRAMVMSFASYHLWLPWQQTAPVLARLFTDYEPGIHYSQVQMQSGTTGINAVRIYNPLKQSHEQDPAGTFIRQWVPELAEVPLEHLHTPWEVPEARNGYPMPIVPEAEARTFAAGQLYGLDKSPEFRTETTRVLTKHASRAPSPHKRRVKVAKRLSAKTATGKAKAAPQSQLGFAFE